eukprot:CAMPEP_0170385684 /NCGR_PEP_ID=MMETSP0117_2-20130122/16644_1 /TAXON_ID=400756 /ORGANISM="Durinskia baltica, Strain CSIRO CS-38" /LENGTH=116 /DNA_ID=CAMNT_0010641479 /DNA_START=13 /DNA_END=360 /DNA_ORIENTATION=+
MPPRSVRESCCALQPPLGGGMCADALCTAWALPPELGTARRLPQRFGGGWRRALDAYALGPTNSRGPGANFGPTRTVPPSQGTAANFGHLPAASALVCVARIPQLGLLRRPPGRDS